MKNEYLQVVTTCLQNEYIRFALAVGLICVIGIVVWLLFREFKLWYSKTETVLDALGSISENIHTINNISENSKSVQTDIKTTQSEIQQLLKEELPKIKAQDQLITVECRQKIQYTEPMTLDAQYEEDDEYDIAKDAYDDELGYDDDEDEQDDYNYSDGIDSLWQDDMDEFDDELEEDIRKKIRL